MTALMDSTGAVAFNHQLVAKAQASYGQSRTKIQAQQWAETLFQQAIQKGRVNKLTSFLRRRQTQLWQLHPSEPTRQLGQRQEEQVQLDNIKGSTNGRTMDFDNKFLPLQTHNKSRWVSVAKAVRLGIKLPPVELIRIDDHYFVVDGHHRLSIAQAMGETAIAANVTIHEIVTP